MSDVRLAPESVEAVARRIVELLADQTAEPGLIDAAEVARRLGCSRSFVYDHLGDLGAIRVGGRWRFDPAALARDRVPPDPEPPAAAPAAPDRRRRRRDRATTAAGAPLLPIKEAA